MRRFRVRDLPAWITEQDLSPLVGTHIKRAWLETRAEYVAVLTVSSESVARRVQDLAVSIPQRIESLPRNSVFVRGLPYRLTEWQLCSLFRGLDVSRFAFKWDQRGRPTGSAFIEFSSERDALRSEQRSGFRLPESFKGIRVLPAKPNEAEDAFVAQSKAQPHGEYVVRLTGFPPGTSKKKIAGCFPSYSFSRLKLCRSALGELNGSAFAILKEKSARELLATDSNEIRYGDGRISVFPSNLFEWEYAESQETFECQLFGLEPKTSEDSLRERILQSMFVFNPLTQ